MSQGKISIQNIKSNNPALHDFIIDFWTFVTKYTPALDSEEWMETVYSEINYYLDKYAQDTFICDILMIQLESMTSRFYKGVQKITVSEFIKDWAKFLNDVIYSDNEKDDEYWEWMQEESDDICRKYRTTTYMQEILNRSVLSLCKGKGGGQV